MIYDTNGLPYESSTESHISKSFVNPDVTTLCSTDLENTVAPQESDHLDASPSLDSTSVTQDYIETSCSEIQHVQISNSCEAEQFYLSNPPDIVIDVPSCLETSPTDRVFFWIEDFIEINKRQQTHHTHTNTLFT